MTVEKTEFTFPDDTSTEIEVENKAKSKVTRPEDDAEIEIVDDVPEQDRNRKPLTTEVAEPTDDELESYSDKVKARIKELTHARHDERRKREAIEREQQEALRFAQQAAEENARLKKQLEEGSTTYATQSQQLAEINLANAKTKLKQAHEAGDSEAFAEAQQEVTSAVLALERAKSFKPTPLQKSSEAGTVSPNAPERPPTVPKPDDKAVKWRNDNPWFGTDKRMTSFALGVHQELVEGGYDTKSDAYYNAINKALRDTFPTAFKSAEKPDSKPPATVVAPATRSTSATKITLTKTQVALANRLGVPLKEYARHVAMEQQKHG